MVTAVVGEEQVVMEEEEEAAKAEDMDELMPAACEGVAATRTLEDERAGEEGTF